ncbi:MAG: porin [Planctomycetota bacterium]|jgi:hypothetical protein|nr:porin [Planctomycetota bacterium]
MRQLLLPSTLAALALVPAAQAFEIAGDAWSMKIEPRIQSWLEIGSTSANSTDVDPFSGVVTDDAQSFNFRIRRARLYFKGSHQDGWNFEVEMNADNIASTSGGNAGNDVDFAKVYAGKTIESDGIEHNIWWGLYSAGDYGLTTTGAYSSAKLLFPNERTTKIIVPSTSGVGVGYSIAAGAFGGNLAISESDSKAAGADDDADLFIAARFYTSIDEEKMTGLTESFLGKDGFHHQLGVGINYEMQAGDTSQIAYGIDYLFHMDAWSAQAEFIGSSRDNGTAGNDTDGLAFNVQGGYALPQDNGTVIEPALRLTYVDADTDLDDEDGVLVGEGYASGLYIDAGANYYLDGHGNKFQLALQYFGAEGDGDGFVLRLAHALEF